MSISMKPVAIVPMDWPKSPIEFSNQRLAEEPVCQEHHAGDTLHAMAVALIRTRAPRLAPSAASDIVPTAVRIRTSSARPETSLTRLRSIIEATPAFVAANWTSIPPMIVIGNSGIRPMIASSPVSRRSSARSASRIAQPTRIDRPIAITADRQRRDPAILVPWTGPASPRDRTGASRPGSRSSARESFSWRAIVNRGDEIAQRTSSDPTMIPPTRPIVARPRARSVMYADTELLERPGQAGRGPVAAGERDLEECRALRPQPEDRHEDRHRQQRAEARTARTTARTRASRGRSRRATGRGRTAGSCPASARRRSR